MQMLKRALIAYVNSIKAVWSAVAYPLSIPSKRKGNVKDYRIYGNSIQDGTPTPENPIEVQSVGELTTKNLFKYIRGQLSNGLYIEELSSGAIVEGNFNPTAVVNAYSRGWFSGGRYDSYSLCPILHTGDVVTVSADITLLELRQDDVYRPQLYFRSRETDKGYSYMFSSILPNETVRAKTKFTIGADYDGHAFYPIFTLNSNVVKIENIQIAYGDDGEYEPYQKYKVPVTVRGKNLLNIPKLFKTALSLNGLTAEPYDTDKIRVYGIPTVSGSLIILKQGSPQYECSLKAGTIVRAGVSLDPTYNNITGGCIYNFQCGLYNKGTWIINAQSQHWKGQTLTSDVTRVNGFSVLINPKDTETYLDFVMCPQFEVGNYVTPFEPYIEPQTFNIYLDKPLKTGEVIQKSTDNLPALPQYKGTTIYEVQTAVPPSGMQVEYYE